MFDDECATDLDQCEAKSSRDFMVRPTIIFVFVTNVYCLSRAIFSS